MLHVLEAAPPEQAANVMLKAEGCSAIDCKAAAQMLLRLILTYFDALMPTQLLLLESARDK